MFGCIWQFNLVLQMAALQQNITEALAIYWRYSQVADEDLLASLRSYLAKNKRKFTEEQYAMVLLTECVLLRLIHRHGEADNLINKEEKRFNRIRNALFAHRWKRIKLVEKMRRGESHEIEQVRQLAEEAKTREWTGEHMRALLLLHLVEAAEGLFKKSLETALQLKYIATASKDDFHIREASWNIAHTYQRFGYNEEALKECEDILPLFGDNLLQPTHLPFYVLLGACYFQNGLIEKSIEVNGRILNFLTNPEGHQQQYYIAAISNLAAGLEQNGNLVEAEKQYKQIQAFAAEKKWPHYELTSVLSLCALYFQLQQLDKMARALKQAEELIAHVKMVEYEVKVLQWKVVLEETKGNYRQAFINHQEFHKRFAEWQKVGNTEKIQALELKQELQLQQLNHEIMRKENQLKQQELQMLNSLLVQKDRLIKEFATQYKELETTALKRKAIFAKLKEMVHSIELSASAEYETYSTKFNEAHLQAVSKMQQRYPQLSNTEARIAIMLSEDLNNKDIATLTLTTVRNIEATRLRLRKKLNLKRGEDLVRKIREVVGEK